MVFAAIMYPAMHPICRNASVMCFEWCLRDGEASVVMALRSLPHVHIQSCGLQAAMIAGCMCTCRRFLMQWCRGSSQLPRNC